MAKRAFFQSPFYRVFECNMKGLNLNMIEVRQLSVPFLSGL